MKVLHLTLKKQWFDMIASGEKKEEYREIKPYWQDRLTCPDEDGKLYDIVKFRNGYQKHSPSMMFLIDGEIKTGFGRPEWGAEAGKKYFVIKLGEKVEVA